MTAIACGPANTGEELTRSQRAVLRTALGAARLVRMQRGVVAVNTQRQKLAMPFPVRTINALARSGYLQAGDDGEGWTLTPAGAAVGGQR